MRRAEIYLTVVVIALASFAAYLGTQTGWNDDLIDPRLSTFLSGPNGASALAQALVDLEVDVERRERAYFTVADSSHHALFAFLDPSLSLTPRERFRITSVASGGGHLALAGHTGIETCLGLRTVPSTEPLGLATATPGFQPGRLPGAERYYGPIDEDDTDTEGCDSMRVIGDDTLLTGPDGEPVAVALALAGGGTVALVADGKLLSNEALRDTDIGALLIPWLLSPGPDLVVVDEYHHGFDAGGSLWGAAWHWLRTRPAGWAVLQLFAVSVLALFVSGARFGPPLPYRRVERRSELEHVSALGVGLLNAGGHQTAIDLLIGGLRRRLGRSGPVGGPDASRQWMETLNPLSPDARQALDVLRNINNEPVARRVRSAADAVEDLWTALTNRQ